MMRAEQDGREWKPGDLAVLPDGSRAIVDRAGRFVYGWGDFQYAKPDSINARGARPLVVIDPEDAEQVDRLAGLVARRVEPGGCPTNLDLAEALREYAKPTPPALDEPRGLGAVVEDTEGRHWVRVEPCIESAIPMHAWRHREPNAEARILSWGRFEAVRVLSEGVS